MLTHETYRPKLLGVTICYGCYIFLKLAMLTQRPELPFSNVDTEARVARNVDNAETGARVVILVLLTMLTHWPDLSWMLI